MRAEKSVNSASENQPLLSSGSPRRRFPSAQPKKMHKRMLATAKVASQNARHIGAVTWLRNSIAMPRRIKHHSTRKIAK